MNRLKLLQNQLKNPKNTKSQIQSITSALDYFDYDQVLTNEEKEYRIRFRQFLEQQVEKQILPYLEKKEFPYELIKKITDNFPGILGLSLKGYNSAGLSSWLSFAVILELGRCDLSLSTFFVIVGDLCNKFIYNFGSEEQKNKYIPKINKFELVCSFCLTEPEFGSDASSLETSVKEVKDENGNVNYILNGKKRWIGNAYNPNLPVLLIVFARNEENKNIEAYLVETKDCEGLDIKVMEGKLALNSVHNCDVNFNNVKIPKINKFEKIKNFQEVSSALLGSRLSVCWASAGVSIGAYDRVIKYCSQRRQFGRPISSLQLIQEKITKIMGNTQAVLYMVKRASDLFLQGKLSIGQVGLIKAWCTYRTRETLAIAREALGGNGILAENWIMKAMIDFEVCHTYEGTADINYLIAGRELTGLGAFK